jgi:RNA polymerase sigma factor (sigma-70 family)
MAAALYELQRCWATIAPRVLAFARRRTRTPEEAEDLVQDAVRRILDGSRKWDGKVSFYGFVCGVVRSQRSSTAKGAARRSQVVPLVFEEDEMPSSRPNPETLLAAFEESHYAPDELVAATREALANKELARNVLDLWSRGVATAREQAQALGVPAEAVWEARRKIQDVMHRLVDERRRRR